MNKYTSKMQEKFKNIKIKYYKAAHLGFLKIKITESPLTNNFGKYLSLLTGLAFFPLLALGSSVHISHTFSRIIFMCLSKALTLAKIFLLFLKQINT